MASKDDHIPDQAKQIEDLMKRIKDHSRSFVSFYHPERVNEKIPGVERLAPMMQRSSQDALH